MQIIEQDPAARERRPTISRHTSLGREFYRSATWEEGDTTVKVTVIAFVTGIRARKNPDGSTTLLEEVSRFDVMGWNEFLQPVERVAFLWDRERMAEDGTTVYDEDMDYSNEIGLLYKKTIAEVEEQCRFFVNTLDFGKHFHPEAWE